MAVDKGFVYAGLGGDTGPRYVALTGLYRSRGGDEPWHDIGASINPLPEARAIAVDSRRSSRVLVGTQAGIYRSIDHGDTWRRTEAPAPGLAVWSLKVHPDDPDVIFAGYEPCAIYRSVDGGVTWRNLHVDVTFPEVTMHPAPQPKRVLGIAIDPVYPKHIYACIEVGGLIRSRDGGETWSNATSGLYVNDDALDLHRVVVSPGHGGVVDVVGRIGMFRSHDHGEHWGHLPVPSVVEGRYPYCRDLVVAPDDPHVLYLGAGAAFESDRGVLYRSTDFGINWWPVDFGMRVPNTVFAVAIDAARPGNIYCAAKSGEVYLSFDHGHSWRVNPLPRGARQVYALAVA